MAEKELDDHVKKQLAEALGDLMPIVVESAGGDIDPAAIELWKERYAAKFQNAILKKGKIYGGDREKLMERAKVLGQRARKVAGSGPITKDHAEAASDKTDCPEQFRYADWCN